MADSLSRNSIIPHLAIGVPHWNRRGALPDMDFAQATKHLIYPPSTVGAPEMLGFVVGLADWKISTFLTSFDSLLSSKISKTHLKSFGLNPRPSILKKGKILQTLGQLVAFDLFPAPTDSTEPGSHPQRLLPSTAGAGDDE